MATSPTQQRWWSIVAMTVLIALPFLAFGRSLLSGFAPIDDSYLVVQNLAARGPTLAHLKAAFTTFDPELYIPLTFVSFQINYLISGLQPWSYHLINILLHGANAVLLFLILRKLTEAPHASFFAAALFAVHPLNAEAVVWITARKDLLSTFFAFASIFVYLRRTERALLLSLGLFLCALLAKVSVAPLPIALLLLDRLQQIHPVRRSLLRSLPFLALSVLFLIVALFGKERIVQTLHFGETLLLIPRSTFFLLGKFLLPRNLSPLYEVSDPIAIANPAIFLPILAFLALFAFLAFLRKKFPTPYPLTLILTFVLLTPAFLTFRKAGTIFLASDRYLYLPSLGVLLVITLFLREIGHRLTLPKPVIAGTSGFLIAFLCLLSTRQAKLWNDPEALFAHALALNPRSIAARTALAQVTLDAGKPQDAFTILKEGLKFGDDSRLHLMAGQVYARVGQVEDALEQFRKAQGMDPGNADVWFSIGSIDEQTGKDEAALYNYRAAIQLDTSDVPARNGAGRILLSRGDLAGAEEQFREALKWNPNSADAHRGMADLLVRQGKQAEADRYRATAREIEQSSE